MKEAFEIALESWTKVNIPHLQRDLDAVGLDIVESQNQGLASRKKLAEQTKEFRKLPDAEKLSEFKNLFKGYQTEIDVLTKRSKTAESAFLNLYKLLSEVPDPCPVIKTAMENADQASRAQEILAENAQLKDDLEVAQNDSVALKNVESALVAAKQKLLNYESMVETMVAERVEQKEAELKEVLDEKIRTYKETEYSLTRQLNLIQDQFVSLQSNHEAARSSLANNSQNYDRQIAARLAEAEILVTDLERANSRVVHVERENQLLREKLEHQTENQLYESDALLQELRNRLNQADGRAMELSEENSSLKTRINDLENQYRTQLNELEREVATRQFEVVELQGQIVQYDDYDELKKELFILKGVEFGSWEAMETDTTVDLSDDSFKLQSMLITKSRKLENEKTDLKVQLEEASLDLQTAKEKLSKYQEELLSKQELIVKLEADLLQVSRIQSGQLGALGSSVSSLGDPLEQIMSDRLSQAQIQERMLASNTHLIQASSQTDMSLIPILTSQRDRYKQRFESLEQVNRQQMEKISNLRYEIETLKKDNVKLYEKIRYVESFSANRHNRDSASIRIRPDADVSTKYKPMYEATLDPFTKFHRQEELRRMQQMNPAEKAALSLTKALISNKYSRFFFFAYSATLHFLVFTMMYQLLHQCDSYTSQRHETLWKHPSQQALDHAGP